MQHGMLSTATVHRTSSSLSPVACLLQLLPVHAFCPRCLQPYMPPQFTWTQGTHAKTETQTTTCSWPHGGNGIDAASAMRRTASCMPGMVADNLLGSNMLTHQMQRPSHYAGWQQSGKLHSRHLRLAISSTPTGNHMQHISCQSLLAGHAQAHPLWLSHETSAVQCHLPNRGMQYSTAARAVAPTAPPSTASSTADQNLAAVSSSTLVQPPAERAGSTLDLSSVIAALQTLSQAEAFLYRFARRLRARHVAQLVARLPSLEMRVENARQRVNTLLRLTTQSLVPYTHQLKGKPLANCIWACAKLGYSPPGVVSSFAHALVRSSPMPLSACNASDLSKLAWALATLQAMYGSSMQTPETTPPVAALQLGPPSQAVDDLTVADNRADTQHADVRSKPGEVLWPPLVKAALTSCHWMSGVEVSQLAWAMAASHLYHQGLFNAMAERAIMLCPKPSAELSGSQLSHLSSPDALARKSFRERRLWYKQQRAAAQAAQQAAKAASAALITSGSSVPALQAGSTDALTIPAKESATRPAAMPTKVLTAKPASDLIWAFTTARHRHPRLFAALAQAALHDQLSLQPEDVSTLLWGYASWGFYDGTLLDMLAFRAVKHIHSLSPEQLSRVMWALATLHHHDALLWKRLPRALATFFTQHTGLAPHLAANLLWALAVMPPAQHNHFTEAAMSHLMQHLDSPGAAQQLSTQQLLRCIWALASSMPAWGSTTPSVARLLATMCDALKSRSPTDMPADVLAPMYHAGLVLGMSAALMSHLPAHVTNANQQDVVQQGTLDIDMHVHMPTPGSSSMSVAALDMQSAHTSAHSKQGTVKLVTAGTAVSHAVTGADGLIDISYVQPLPGLTPQPLLPETSLLAQLAPDWAAAAHQAALVVAGKVTTQTPLQLSSISHSHHSNARSTSQDGSNCGQTDERSPITGCVHEPSLHPVWFTEVQQALQDMGLVYVEQVPAVHGTVILDLAIMTKSAKVAFCFEGPKQYSRSSPHVLLGHPHLVRRLLQADDWRVVSIPWYEWSLMYTEEEQYSYLCNLLAAQQVHLS